MSEENNKNQNENQPIGFNQQRCDQQQYDMLKRCSDKKDMTEWNEWRKEYPDEVIWLQGANFEGWHLQGANFGHFGHVKQFYKKTNTYISFGEVHLEEAVFERAALQKTVFAGAKMNRTKFWSANAEGADFSGASLIEAKLEVAHFENCRFDGTILKNARFSPSWLNGAKFTESDLRGCSISGSVVDGSTRFWNCIINRYSKDERFTDITGTPLDNVIIDPATKQLLKYNIRRMNWEDWYKEHKIPKWPVWLFWQMSDYGISTPRIISWFFGLAFGFAVIYRIWPGVVMVRGGTDYLRDFIHALYFSVVTMTTLGFGDIAANPDSHCGQILLMVQVILGYVLLGALITRLAVLFTGEGPAGKFADKKKN